MFKNIVTNSYSYFIKSLLVNNCNGMGKNSHAMASL
jgi:hypothetical protein